MMNPLPIGPVMLDIAGLTLSLEERELIAHPNTGAVILFARNYANPEQVTELIHDLRSARNGELLIAVDQEGGRVQRFQNGFTRLPPAAAYALRPELAEPAGMLMAMELLAVGVDFSFAPVLDVDCGVSEIIGNRAFAQDAETVSELASAFMKGMHFAGMAATGKHFPGHGTVALDSHLTLPVDERSLAQMSVKDLMPFQELIAKGLAAIMPAHVLYPNIDSQPAGFSSFWLGTILRQALKFDGVIFSDDLTMEGAAFAGDYPERARLALEAGCDMVLVCNNQEAAKQVISTLPIMPQPDSIRRLQTMKGKPMLTWEQLHQSEDWQRISNQLQQFSESYANRN